MTETNRSRPGALIGVAFSGVFLGAILGAITNAVNGWVSPLYFRNIMRWDDVQDIWRASIAQGILEGIMFGLAFAVIFTAVVGIVSKARSPYGLAAVHLVLIGVAALVCWALGGRGGDGLGDTQPRILSARIPWRPGGLRPNAPLCVGGRLDLGHPVWRTGFGDRRLRVVPGKVAAHSRRHPLSGMTAVIRATRRPAIARAAAREPAFQLQTSLPQSTCPWSRWTKARSCLQAKGRSPSARKRPRSPPRRRRSASGSAGRRVSPAWKASVACCLPSTVVEGGP